MKSSFCLVLILVISLAFLIQVVQGHGCVNTPNQRGSLTAKTDYIFRTIDSTSVIDYNPHFPAGHKGNRPLSGLFSQKQAAGPNGWVPYEPLKKGFVWRSGVCGDEKYGPQHHLRGGQYYNNGEIVATYTQGGTISIGLSVSAHHNGFMELHICDVSKCGGEISFDCFTSGNCRQLQRAPNPLCDSGTSRWCGPIDPNYKGRFYMPPTRYYGQDNVIERFGADENGDTILYQIPSDFYCEHCVLQWYWTSANTCNPPGVKEYFKSNHRPYGWGRLPGQGGAYGGVARGQKACGKSRFPEEYIQCIDVRITKRGGATRRGIDDMKPVSPGSNNNDGHLVSEEQVEQARNGGSGHIRMFMLIADGKRIAILNQPSHTFDARGWTYVTIEAITSFGVPHVEFSINGRKGGTSYGPNFQPTNARRWLPFNQWISISANVWADFDYVSLLLRK